MYDAVLPDTGVVAMPLVSPIYGETLVVAVAGLTSRVRSAEASILANLRTSVAALSREVSA